MTLSRFVIALCLFAGIYGVLPGQATISSISSNSAQLGQTLTVNITGTDLNWMLGCGSALSSTNEAWIDGGGHPDITSNSISISPTLITATFTIPNDVTYVGNNTLNVGAYYPWPGGICWYDNAPFYINYGPGGKNVFLRGKAYWDGNNNCTQDSGEPVKSGTIIRADPGAIYFSTDSSGNFGFWAPGANYTFTIPNEPLFGGTCPGTINVAAVVPGDTFITDIGIVPDSVADLRVAMSSTPARPGFAWNLFLDYGNYGLIQETGTLKVAVDTLIQNLASSPSWDLFANDTAFFYLSGLPLNQSNLISFSGTIPTLQTVSFGQQLISKAIIIPDGQDAIPSNNFSMLQDPIVGAFDPNDKTLMNPGIGNTGALYASDTLLDYRIRFQNTGTDTAFNVLVRDSLSPYLNQGTLTVLGSSHPYYFTLDSGVVEWHFPNILLPDSGQNEPASHGWVRYQIQRDTGFLHGTSINNQAEIYFDFNPPIFTNRTQNRACLPFSPQISANKAYACPASPTLLSAPGGQLCYQWSTGDSLSTSLVTTTGVYELVLCDSFGCLSDTGKITINSPPPVSSSFSWTSTQNTLSFIDSSSGNPTGWNWDFGDGSTSSSPNPSHSYLSTDTFEVCLIANNGCQYDTHCVDIPVNCNRPQTGFSWTSTNLSYSFQDQTTGFYNTRSWDFGDGNYSAAPNPTHTYASPGNYVVCHMTGNDCGSDTSCQTLMVVGMEEEALAGIRLYPNPSAGRVTVELGLVDPGRVSLRMFSVTGAQIPVRPDRSSGGHRLELDLSQLATGVYFLEIAGPEGVAHRKILLER